MQNDIARFGGLLCMAFVCLNFEQSKAIIVFMRCMIEYRIRSLKVRLWRRAVFTLGGIYTFLRTLQ